MLSSNNMKAWGQTEYGSQPEKLRLVEVPRPVPGPRDLLIRVKAVALNPVDTLQRENWGHPQKNMDETPLIIGYDGSGVVEEMGREVTMFRKDEAVMFVPSLKRPGCYAEYCLVDERVVGKKPESLSFEEAAALPLTALTAWETMVDGFGIDPANTKLNARKKILIVGGAGGVGSIAIQIAKKVLNLQVIATGSRPESREYAKMMGADIVIDHSKDLVNELRNAGMLRINEQKEVIGGIDYVFHTHKQDLMETFATLCTPGGHIGLILPPTNPVNLSGAIFEKSLSITTEFMGARSVYGIDVEKQGEVLNRLAKYVDQKILQSHAKERFDFAKLPQMNENLQQFHNMGKWVSTVKF